MRQLLAAFARNRVFANIVLALIFLTGGMAAMHLVRETYPEFSTEMIRITVPYPGADPEEVEEGVCKKLEQALEGLDGVKEYTTYSAENIGSAVIKVKENSTVSHVLDMVKAKVGAIATFPVGAEKPIISEMLIRDGVELLSLSGDIPERTLKELAERMKTEILQNPNISQVEIVGARDYEIAVEVSEEKLREFGLTFHNVASAIQNSNVSLAGGTIRTEGEEIRIRTIGRKYTGKELSSIAVMTRPTGEIVTLGRVAKIDDGFTEEPISATLDGRPSLLMIVFKTSEEDALTISEAVREFVQRKAQQLPKNIDFRILYDNTEMLRSRLDLLIKNGAMGLALVLFLLWLFMDKRLSFWVGMGIPVSIAGALAVMWAMGGTLNMISLFALIMVLGILVDDAIVIGEAIFFNRQKGLTPLKAAVEGVCEVGLPVTASVVTTIAAFVPLAFVTGILGKFIFILPVVVISCLFFSLIESLILLPAHLNHLPDTNASGKKHLLFHPLKATQHFFNKSLEWSSRTVYGSILKKALAWRYVLFCSLVASLLLTLGLIQSGIIKFQIFPRVDNFLISSNVQFPRGTPIEVTRNAVRQLEAAIQRVSDKTATRSGDPLVKNRLAVVGELMGGGEEKGPHLGSVQVILLDSEKRGIHSKDILVAWEQEAGPIPGVKSLTFEAPGSGLEGTPIEIWLKGSDLDRVVSASNDLTAKLRGFNGVYQVNSDFEPGKNEIRLELKPDARALGLTVGDLARQVYAGYYGQEAVRIQRGHEDVRVKVRYTSDERSRLSDFERIRIRTIDGHEVPLISVADLSFGPGYSVITRTGGMRRVAVSAAVDTNKANANEIYEDLSNRYFPKLRDEYPGVFVSLEGEEREMEQSFSSLTVGYPLAIVAIFVIMATIFRSYAQPFIILFTVPFGIIGAILGHLALGYDLSIMSIFGIVALTGIVVNDAIILIEKINSNLSQGVPFYSSVLEGGKRRFRPVILTTVTTIGGLAPLILETDLQAKFLIPMAVSIAAGLIFATILTLILIPSLIGILNDLRCALYRIKKGSWPAREEIEPATSRNLFPYEEKTMKASPEPVPD